MNDRPLSLACEVPASSSNPLRCLATISDREATLAVQPADILFTLHVTAANDAGESTPGPDATITLG